ncbi:heparinase II/III family protein [Thalassobaculum sp. OXR-137]|uniref:heparinase II/III family protein n=1 Tax=Thalassobaculum sp. OXR-137 TaxID=3100173 RepID=UPI002AC9B31B|nr:heparinase II/III family protein [Thalassobaculum sp. OXR-137]WPZ35335.1 heparinase II/III family protein [Thalassobaculum sp. OXR-137]
MSRRRDRRGLSDRLRDAYFASPVHAWRLSGPVPDGLAVSITDAWTGDSDLGRELLEGTYTLGGTAVQVGADPWGQTGYSDAALEALHRFEWLRDLRDLGGDAARRRARDLVGAWIERYPAWDRLAWRADLLAARVAAWVHTFGFFADSADDEFRRRVLESLIRQYRHLQSAVESGPDGVSRLETLRGALIAGVALGADGDEVQGLVDRLDAAIRAQVLPDGGHRSRSPAMQTDALVALVDARAALRAAGRESTAALDETIQRMTGVLRMLRHGDGGLALFNGATEGQVWRLDTLIARTEAKTRAVTSALETGFERLVAGRAVAIIDTGAPVAADDTAHAGTLSLEFSVGKERLVVNCGAAPGDPRWQGLLRASAAHSGLVIDDTNTTELRADGSLGRRPAQVRLERWEADGAVWVEAEHDGYRESHSILHRRRLFLAAGGDDLRGEDVLTYTGGPGAKPTEAAIRFHLHPRVSASLIQNGASVLLRMPSGGGWRLRVTGGKLALNESVYFGEGGHLQRTRQIVIGVPLDELRELESISVKWALRREDRR